LFLNISDFELGKCVGSGKFGDVFICKHKETGTLYALKKIFKSTINEYNMI
jgi:serine/threonine protein kinase